MTEHQKGALNIFPDDSNNESNNDVKFTSMRKIFLLKSIHNLLKKRKKRLHD